MLLPPVPERNATLRNGIHVKNKKPAIIAGSILRPDRVISARPYEAETLASSTFSRPDPSKRSARCAAGARAGRLGLVDRIDERLDVLDQLALVERRLAGAAMHDRPTRNSTAPPGGLHAPAMSIVTVPTRGACIRPRGPRTCRGGRRDPSCPASRCSDRTRSCRS